MTSWKLRHNIITIKTYVRLPSSVAQVVSATGRSWGIKFSQGGGKRGGEKKERKKEGKEKKREKKEGKIFTSKGTKQYSFSIIN